MMARPLLNEDFERSGSQLSHTGNLELPRTGIDKYAYSDWLKGIEMPLLIRNSLFGYLDFGELVCNQFSAKLDESLDILQYERAATTILPSIR